ncbi:MAG: PHP domain-containing protein [Chloroflexota bacterium]
MHLYRADLHVHSVLSPCADDLMFPGAVVAAARDRGVILLGLTDHNSAENVAAFVAAGERAGVVVLPGIEVTTREEVHVVTLFQDVASALAWQSTLYAHLPSLPNNERLFGTQFVVGPGDEVLGINNRLLLTAADLGLAEVAATVHRLGGLAIPAHVDRPAFGLLGQLGFLPPDLDVVAVEVSRLVDPRQAAALYPSLAGRTVVQSSDAHHLDDVGKVGTNFWLEAPTLHELRLALAGREGRYLTYDLGGTYDATSAER